MKPELSIQSSDIERLVSDLHEACRRGSEGHIISSLRRIQHALREKTFSQGELDFWLKVLVSEAQQCRTLAAQRLLEQQVQQLERCGEICSQQAVAKGTSAHQARA